MALEKIELTYSSRSSKPVCWLTWLQRENGIVELRCVSLTRKHAGFALRDARNEVKYNERYKSPFTKAVRAWQEERDAEHIYGNSMNKEMMALAAMTKPKN